MNGIFGAGLAGIQRAEEMLYRTASDLSKITPETDIVGDMVNLRLAKFQMKASAKVLQTAADVEEKILDIFA